MQLSGSQSISELTVNAQMHEPKKPWMLKGKNLADIVIFLGMAINAVVILLILYFFVF